MLRHTGNVRQACHECHYIDKYLPCPEPGLAYGRWAPGFIIKVTAACRFKDSEDERRLAARPLPALVATFTCDMASCLPLELSSTALALASTGLRSLDSATARAIDGHFCCFLARGQGQGQNEAEGQHWDKKDGAAELQSVAVLLQRQGQGQGQGERAVSLSSVAALLQAFCLARREPSAQLLAQCAEWVAASAASSEVGAGLGLGKGFANPSQGCALDLPAAAARLLRAWANGGWSQELPMDAVWALAASAAAGAGAPKGRGGFTGRDLPQTLYSLAYLVSRRQLHAHGVEVVLSIMPGSLQGAIARWAPHLISLRSTNSLPYRLKWQVLHGVGPQHHARRLAGGT